MKKLILMTLLMLSALAQAQSSESKKELVSKVLRLQQPALDSAAQTLAERPAAQMMQQAVLILQSRVAPEQRQAIAKAIQADVKKYLDEATPLVRQSALKLSPSTIGVLLDERFSEDELKQLIAIIESPVNRKFLQLTGEMQKVLGDRLVAETRDAIDPKVKLLQQSISKRLNLPTTGPVAGTPPPTKAASQ